MVAKYSVDDVGLIIEGVKLKGVENDEIDMVARVILNSGKEVTIDRFGQQSQQSMFDAISQNKKEDGGIYGLFVNGNKSVIIKMSEIDAVEWGRQ